MKTLNKFFFFTLLSTVALLPGCKDNILKPVTDSKSADSLIAVINTLNNKLITVNATDNSLKIQLAKFQSSEDSLKAAGSSYSQLVQYTVYVVDGGTSVTGLNYFYGDRTCNNCKTNGVDGAVVTVYSNGQTYVATSADGRAIFNNLYSAGLATVTITANGYTRASYTTYFNSGTNKNGGVSSVTQGASSIDIGEGTYPNISPSSTTGAGTGATFTLVGEYDEGITNIYILNPGSGYKNGDLITFNGSDICSCSGSATYKVITSTGPGSAGVSINASTNVLILPTAGKSMTTYTGQLYINKSIMDDTLGRLYNNAQDASRYLTFISPNGPYHGPNFTNSYLGVDYAQNQYFAPPNGAAINFTNLTTLAGTSFIYGFPTYLSTYYDPNPYNYYGNTSHAYLPGDIISITYNGLTSFATIDVTGKYTLNVPSYQNNPGTTIGASAGLGFGGGGSLIHYQDNYTYLSSTNSTGSTNPTLNVYDPTTYGIAPNTTFYQITKMFDFYPFIELDYDGGYAYIGGNSGYTQQFYSSPGQTLSRNIFFFATKVTGQ